MSQPSLEELTANADNVYEAVVMMSKRARQINDEQKIMLDMEKDVDSVPDVKDNEDFDDVEIDREALMREYTKFPKPTRVAMQEVIDKKLIYWYDEPEVEEQG